MTEQRSNETGELDLSLFFKALSKTRPVAIIAAILAALLFTVFVLVTSLAIPATTTHKQLIQLTFFQKPQKEDNGDGDDKENFYPNGKRFNYADFLSPVILNKVYQSSDLQNYDLKQTDFVNAVSVSPHNATHSFIVQRYTKRLNNKKLTFAERKSIEKAMKKELNEMQTDRIFLRLIFNKDYGIPDNIAQKTLSNLAREWADFEINQQGVLKLPDAITGKSIIDPSLVDPLTPYTSLSYLTDKNIEIQNKINLLKKIDGAATVIDEKTGLSINNLSSRVQSFDDYKMKAVLSKLQGSSSQNNAMEKRMIKAQIKVLKIRRDRMIEKARAIKEQLRAYDNRDTMKDSPGQSGQSKSPAMSDTNITQLNDGFINRIIALSEKSKEDVEYRQKLIEDQTKLLDEAANLDYLQKRKDAILVAMTPSLNRTNSENSTIEKGDAKKEFSDVLSGLTTQLNTYWQTLGRISDSLGSKKINYSGTLYSPMSIDDEELKQSFHPILNGQTGLLFLLAILGSMALAVLAHLLWQVLQPKNTEAS